MKRLPNVKLSLEEYRQILALSKKGGSEGTFYYSSSLPTGYKVFSSPNLKGCMNENKEKKLALLYQKNLDYCTRPISTLSVNGILVGYELTYDPDDEVLLPYRENLIHYLEESKRCLEYFAHHEIIYGDVAERNILINRRSGDLRFCDMDNISIGCYPIDLPSKCSEEYRSVWGIDQNLDIYMHNLMCLHSFDIDLQHYFLDYFEFYFEKQAEDIVKKMQDVKSYHGESIVPYIKKR